MHQEESDWDQEYRQLHLHPPGLAEVPSASHLQSPNVPHYVNTQKFPVKNLSDLRQKPTIDNITAHQSYLEYLQFEQCSLRHWSNVIKEQIIAENHQAHEQLARMMAVVEAQQQQIAWRRVQAQQRMHFNAAATTCPIEPHEATTCPTYAYVATTCSTDANADSTFECYVASEA